MSTLIQLRPIGDSITVVNSYSDLPAPNTVAGKYYWVSNSQGTSWLPGLLGGTYYPKGLYYSNGTTWEYLETPYQATQIEVDGGTVDDKFVTPFTLENSNLARNAIFTIDLIDVLTVDFYAPNDLRINSTTLISGSGTITLEVNNNPYTLTTLINQGDKITVITTTPSVINLNSRYE
jgi:autotransporter-associated beta strand protein